MGKGKSCQPVAATQAPLSIQQMAKCVVGVDYPAPIVDHNKAKEANMKKMKDVFDGVVPLGPPGAGVKAVDHAPKALFVIKL